MSKLPLKLPERLFFTLHLHEIAIYIPVAPHHFIRFIDNEQMSQRPIAREIDVPAPINGVRANELQMFEGASFVFRLVRVFLVGQQILITGKVIGVETGRVYVKQVRGEQTGQLLSLAETLGSEIAATVKLNRDKLCAPDIAKEKDKRMAELAERLEGKQLPRVAISIPERHYGQPVIDPAVETELMYWFNKCGFAVSGLTLT